MECPSCGEDNLLGAKVCMSCGAKLTFEFAAPPIASPPPPAEPAAAPTGAPGMQTVICPLCSEPFKRAAGDDQAACSTCRKGFATAAAAPDRTFDPSGGGGASAPRGRASTDELNAPGSHATPQGWGGEKAEEQFGQLLGTASRRPPPIKKVKTFRWGLVLTPLILVGAAAGGWFYMHSLDRTRRLLDEMRPQAAELVVAPADAVTTATETRYTLRIYHGEKRGTFSDDLDAKLDIRQTVLQLNGVTLDRVGASGAMCSVRSQISLVEQTGTVDGKSAAGAKIHPYEGHNAGERLVLALTGPPSRIGGEAALVGRDVSPFSTVGTLGRSAASLNAGDRWEATVDLPLLANLGGGLFAAPFRCSFEYVGRGLRAGRECVGIHVVARPPSTPPAQLSSMSACTGEVRGALFFDATTGLMAEATLDVELAAVSAGDRKARVDVTGVVTIKGR